MPLYSVTFDFDVTADDPQHAERIVRAALIDTVNDSDIHAMEHADTEAVDDEMDDDAT